MIVIFNLIGLAMMLIGFGIPMAVAKVLEAKGNDPAQVAAGVLLLAMDIAWRLKKKPPPGLEHELAMVHPKLGGQFFFVPIWMWGAFWLLLGAYRLAVQYRLF